MSWRARIFPLMSGLPMVAIAMLLGACAAGPDYQRPEIASDAALLPAADPMVVEVEGFSAAAPVADWWQTFDDPLLGELVATALERNHDLQIAEANIRAARALLRAEGFRFFPIVTAAAAASRQQFSTASGAASGLVGGGDGGGAVEVDRTETFYDAALDGSWELDFFGRVRRSVEALAADYDSREAALHAAQVAVAAEVGRTYAELRGAQSRLDVARNNASNQRQTFDLTQALLDGGRGTDLDIARAQAQLETTLASVPPLENQVAGAVHRLGVLTGQTPNALAARLASPRPIPDGPELVGVGSAEDLLRRRPDVRLAERGLAADTARVGIAVGELFPRVSLTGSFGYLSTDLDDLFKDATERYDYGPVITWAAFDLGRVRARIRATEAGADASLARYEQAVLEALEDTRNAMIRYNAAQRRQERLNIAAEASDEAANLARLRYRNGVDSFLNVLDAERRLLDAQDLSAQADIETMLALVSLYRALGGGWPTLLPEAADLDDALDNRSDDQPNQDMPNQNMAEDESADEI